MFNEGMVGRKVPALGTWSWLRGDTRHRKGCLQEVQ